MKILYHSKTRSIAKYLLVTIGFLKLRTGFKKIIRRKSSSAPRNGRSDEVRTKDAHVMEGMVVSKMQREFARYREDLLAAAERARKAEVNVASAR